MTNPNSIAHLTARQIAPLHALRRRIEARYKVVTETVRVGHLRFPFTRIADPDRVLDEVAAEEDRLEKISGRRAQADYLHLPYWAELWESAMGVATFLVEGIGKPSFIREYTYRESSRPNVLDLGCGMGLSGTIAAALGMPVLFADLETPALLFAELNSMPFAHPWLRRRPELGKRWFGYRRWSPRVRTRRVDWRSDQLGERFQLILGADILYERKQWDHLEPFWRAHLAPGGMILLGEPGRPTGDLFPEWIRAKGWSLTPAEQSVSTRPEPIRLFMLQSDR